MSRDSSVARSSAGIAVVSLLVQFCLYSWLTGMDSSGPLGGLIIIPQAIIVIICVATHGVLMLVKGQKFFAAFAASVLFWAIGLGVPFAYRSIQDGMETSKGMEREEVMLKNFRNFV